MQVCTAMYIVLLLLLQCGLCRMYCLHWQETPAKHVCDVPGGPPTNLIDRGLLLLHLTVRLWLHGSCAVPGACPAATRVAVRRQQLAGACSMLSPLKCKSGVFPTQCPSKALARWVVHVGVHACVSVVSALMMFMRSVHHPCECVCVVLVLPLLIPLALTVPQRQEFQMGRTARGKIR